MGQGYEKSYTQFLGWPLNGGLQQDSSCDISGPHLRNFKIVDATKMGTLESLDRQCISNVLCLSLSVQLCYENNRRNLSSKAPLGRYALITSRSASSCENRDVLQVYEKVPCLIWEMVELVA